MLRQSCRRNIAFFGGALLAFLVLLFWPVDIRRTALSPSLLAADGALLRAYPAPDGQMRLPITADDVDPFFIKMLLAYEDRHYYWHPGIDPLALLRAGYQWAHTGKIVSGGSTITMQVARLLHPAPRTLSAKLAEIWRALRLSAQYSKHDILNFYLRLAPYGGDLAGLRAAALVYFGKEPKQLTPDEAALLVVVPQDPNDFRPDRFPDAARTARAKVLQRLAEKGVISRTALAAGLAAPIPGARHPLPVFAPHLADQLRANHAAQSPWQSTLDAALQIKLEAILRARLEQLSPQATIAALVVDNYTHALRAYVGNADYFSTARAGQVDMVNAIRSPGSTLKPFLYGMAFQDGLAQPETIIRDAPTRFGAYMPSNFNQGYQGEVTLRQALQQSLNIPAVKILSQVGSERWLAKLRAVGAQLTLPEGATTAELPIILGGLGTRLWDLALLYTGLANGGQVAPLHLLQNETASQPQQLLNNLSAWQVTDILTGAPLNEGMVRGPSLAQLAVKTGTSYGYRDAWAMGYTPAYTVTVWAGRADGSPSPGQVGRNTAVPILLSIYDLLPATQGDWPPPPRGAVVAHESLPANLQHWLGDRATGNAATIHAITTTPLAITYPIDGSSFKLSEIDPHGIKFTAQGGAKPYQWYVNGAPLPDAGEDALYWQPTSAGHYKITLQDQTGQILRYQLKVEN